MKISVVLVSIVFILLNGSYYKEVDGNQIKPNFKINPLLLTDFRNIRDTIFTMKDHIVEINLSTHKGTVRFRNGKHFVFPVSGGTKWVKDGIETREGLYVLHWKSELQYSVQFDSTKMLYWMSFNSGIGLHALTTNGYYKYLGKKNVSHGCVRMTREDAKELFDILERGVAVLVHKGESAIAVEFGKLGEVYKYYSYKELKKVFKKRLTNLYRGEYFLKNKNKILIDEDNVTAAGLPLGNSNKIITKQILPPENIYLAGSISEADKLKQILNGDAILNTQLSYNRQLDSLYAQL
ncbi:hypothetical protein BMS3Abin03_02305 [bacterium BMS3Abin03]|nr:hypothetical protein BMS3Abin03_02305 [bacterium BMS3Abin03]